MVATLGTWHDPEALRDLVTLVVVDRPGVPPVEPAPEWRVVRITVAPVDVSSTDLRAALEAGRTVDGLIPDPVIRCIAERGLYAGGR